MNNSFKSRQVWVYVIAKGVFVWNHGYNLATLYPIGAVKHIIRGSSEHTCLDRWAAPVSGFDSSLRGHLNFTCPERHRLSHYHSPC